MHRWEITQRLVAGRVIGIVRADDTDRAAVVATTLVEAGLPAVEVALTTPGAVRVLERLAGEVGPDGPLLGAGTVLDAVSAGRALDAGARFLVSPALDRAVIETCHRHGAACVPGVATATEIVRGLSWGADLLKLFPASALTPGWLTAVRAALPQAPLVPTGGVDAGNARAWLDAGAVAVAVGGALTRGGPDDIRARAQRLLEAVGVPASG